MAQEQIEDMTLPLEVKYKRLVKQCLRQEQEIAEKDARIAELEKRSFRLWCRVNQYKDIKRLQKASQQLLSFINRCTEQLLGPCEAFNDEQKQFSEKAILRLDELKEELKDYMQP